MFRPCWTSVGRIQISGGSVVFGSALLARCNLWSDIDVYFECQSEPQRLPSIVSERQAFDKFSNFTVSETFRRTILQDGVVVYER